MASESRDRAAHGPLEHQQYPIHHVGVCVDRSPLGDRVIPHAVALAKAFGARLTVLHAL
ncbi:MAG: universal stress protein, partial [Deltaproteobacteria bacterium]|nr:universal stress protein [Deltaproteobacteria bacterium]